MISMFELIRFFAIIEKTCYSNSKEMESSYWCILFIITTQTIFFFIIFWQPHSYFHKRPLLSFQTTNWCFVFLFTGEENFCLLHPKNHSTNHRKFINQQSGIFIFNMSSLIHFCDWSISTTSEKIAWHRMWQRPVCLFLSRWDLIKISICFFFGICFGVGTSGCVLQSRLNKYKCMTDDCGRDATIVRV